jgi:hypothetical protein
MSRQSEDEYEVLYKIGEGLENIYVAHDLYPKGSFGTNDNLLIIHLGGTKWEVSVKKVVEPPRSYPRSKKND